MPQAAVRLSVLVSGLALGATGATLAIMGTGLPFAAAVLIAAAAAGLLHYVVLTRLHAPEPAPEHPSDRAPGTNPASITQTDRPHTGPIPEHDPTPEHEQTIAAGRAHLTALRHDIRGVLSPALIMSDRLVNHPDPAIQRAGQAVIHAIERAAALLAETRDPTITPPAAPSRAAASTAAPDVPAPPAPPPPA